MMACLRLIIIGAALVVLTACAAPAGITGEGVPRTAAQNPDRVRMVDEPFTVQDFTLPASTGEDMAFSELRGQWVMLFFGYTHCPDFCPLTLVDFIQVKDLLGEEAGRVSFVYISVDPLRDTPEVMGEYLAFFDPDFIGFTGDDETLLRIHTDYNLYYRRRVDVESNTYVVDHSTRTYLIDPQGRLRLSFAYATESEIMAGVLRDYLAGQE